MKILISGAYGFVGTNLSRYLAAKGHKCIALDIAKGNAEAYSGFHAWDGLDGIDWPSIDAVVHLAGKAHDLKKVSDPQSYFDINVGLTERLFNVCNGKVSRFIYFSSSKAADADTPYGKSKLAAEQFLDGRAIVLRPAMIHGPGNKGNLNLLWGIARRGFPWPLAARGRGCRGAAYLSGLRPPGRRGSLPTALSPHGRRVSPVPATRRSWRQSCPPWLSSLRSSIRNLPDKNES